jgi:hypothetical protein
MRRELLVRVGGNFYYRTPVIFQLGRMPCIWLSRDEQKNLLVNFRMPTVSGELRASVVENFWSVPTDVDELVCPPMGRLIEVSYRNGDRFKLEFLELAGLDALAAKYPNAPTQWMGDLPFPLTLVEAWETAAGTTLEFGPNHSRIGGMIMVENFASNCGAGIQIGMSDEQLAELFPRDTTDE